jgi:hypothetical protein
VVSEPRIRPSPAKCLGCQIQEDAGNGGNTVLKGPAVPRRFPLVPHFELVEEKESMVFNNLKPPFCWNPEPPIDLEMSKDLSDALFNPRESSLFREPSREGLLDYGSGRARAGFGSTRGGRKKTEPKWGHRNGRPGQYGQRETSDVATRPLGHRQAPASSGNFVYPGVLGCAM